MVHTLTVAKDLSVQQHTEESKRLNEIIRTMEVSNQEHIGYLAHTHTHTHIYIYTYIYIYYIAGKF